MNREALQDLQEKLKVYANEKNVAADFKENSSGSRF